MLIKQVLFSKFLVFVSMLALLLAGTSSLEAANIQFKKNTVTPSGSMQLSTKPDLVITHATWSNPIRSGDVVGESSILNITILNRGSAPAGENKLKITCTPLSGNSCPPGLSGFRDIQPLEKGNQ